MNTKTISELSVDTQVLIDRLKKVEPEHTITYAELSAAIGRNVQNGARHLMETARRRLIADHQILFDVVTNEGLKRVQGDQIVAVGSRGVKHIGRHARRTAKKIGCIGDDYSKLSKEQQHRFNGVGTILSFVSHATKEKQVAKISDAASEKLPLAKTLELFK
jgi:hypothetical protein